MTIYNVTMLKIKGIRKVFKSPFKREKGVVALDDINLSFSKNELVFIVGKSGSGKSTLLIWLLIIFTSSVVSLVISLLTAKSYKPINILKSKY